MVDFFVRKRPANRREELNEIIRLFQRAEFQGLRSMSRLFD